jgi:hypothetical protein
VRSKLRAAGPEEESAAEAAARVLPRKPLAVKANTLSLCCSLHLSQSSSSRTGLASWLASWLTACLWLASWLDFCNYYYYYHCYASSDECDRCNIFLIFFKLVRVDNVQR